MTPTLTIAIPTRDRNQLLRDHLALLVPQLTPETRLIVLDNASPTPVAETLAELLRQHPEAPVTVSRNRVNIGSSANVMRCIERCESPWLWILGDDDRPMPDAIATALAAIRRHSKCVVINFSSAVKNPDGEIVSDGLEDFVRRMPSFANTTLISNNLYRADRLADHVWTGCFFAYSLYPHLTCVLSELHAKGGQCCFTSAQIVEWGPDSHWSRLMAGAGMGVLLDLPIPHRVRQLLVPKLVGVAGRFSSLAVLLLDQVGITLDAPTARYMHEQAYQRLYRHEHRLMNHVYRWLGKAMLWMPGPSAKLYRKYRKMRGDPRSDKPRDDMGRM
jgi:glycosyltransferase involved in cell wall biosynthesis